MRAEADRNRFVQVLVDRHRAPRKRAADVEDIAAHGRTYQQDAVVGSTISEAAGGAIEDGSGSESGNTGGIYQHAGIAGRVAVAASRRW